MMVSDAMRSELVLHDFPSLAVSVFLDFAELQFAILVGALTLA